MTTDNDGKKLVGLRVRLTPEDYDFAEHYGQELSYGGARGFLRALLLHALAGERKWARERVAQLKAEEAERLRSPAQEPSCPAYPDFDEDLPF